MLVFPFFPKSNYRVRLDVPTIEVRFEHLTVEAKVYIGSRALPTLLNFAINMLQVNLLDHININSILILVIIFPNPHLMKLPLGTGHATLSLHFSK